MEFEFDPEKIKQESEDARQRKVWMNTLGGVADAFQNRQSAAEILLGLQKERPTAGDGFRSVASGIEDPAERQKKLYEGYVQSQNAKKLEEDVAQLALAKDPNSQKSKAMKALAPRWGLVVTPDMSAYDIEQMIDPKKMMETEAISQVNNKNQEALQDRLFEQQKTLKHMDMQGDMRKEAIRLGAEQHKESQKKSEEKVKGEKEFRNRYKSIDDELKQLEALIDKKGTYEMFGSHNNELAQKIDSIAIDSAKMFDPQSVARESEVAAFKNMLFEPGTKTTRNSTAKDILKSYKAMLDRRAETQLGERPDTKKSVVNRKINPKTGQTKLVYSDGSEEIVSNSVAGR